MIPDIENWTRRHEGEDVILLQHDDPSRGFIRYSEGLTPVAAPMDLLGAHLARLPELQVESIAPAEELVTHEGEFAALISTRTRRDGELWQLDTGYVLGDVHYARVLGATTRPELFETFTATVRDLVLADQQHLGVRRRRYRHSAPDGWTATARGLASMIYEAPEGGAQIDVSPALPNQLDLDQIEGQMFTPGCSGGLVIERCTDAAPIVSRYGLHGRQWELTCRRDGEPVVRRVATFVDDRYAYSLRLESPAGVGRRVFDEVVYSVQPLPRPRRVQTAAEIELLAHWS